MSEKQESLVPTGIPTCRDCYAAMPREPGTCATVQMAGVAVKARSKSEARRIILKTFRTKTFPYSILKIIRLPRHTHYEDWPK